MGGMPPMPNHKLSKKILERSFGSAVDLDAANTPYCNNIYIYIYI
jgi:hypothetical protein